MNSSSILKKVTSIKINDNDNDADKWNENDSEENIGNNNLNIFCFVQILSALEVNQICDTKLDNYLMDYQQKNTQTNNILKHKMIIHFACSHNEC